MPSFNRGSSEEGGGRGEGETLEDDAEGVRHETCEGPVERNLSRVREEPREGEREREKRKRLKRGLLKARTPEPHVRPHLAQFNSLTTSHVPRPHPAAPLKRPSPALRLSPANPTPSQPPRRAHLILFPYQNTEHPHSSVLIQAKLAPPARSTVP